MKPNFNNVIPVRLLKLPINSTFSKITQKTLNCYKSITKALDKDENLPKVMIDDTRMVVLLPFFANFDLILFFPKAFTANFEKALISWVIGKILSGHLKPGDLSPH